jgi:sulfate transport system ATP-binding protein
VMGFLGSVNVFHGRVEAGRAHLGPLSVEYPDHADEAPRPAQGFARPHELDLARHDGTGGGFWATLRHASVVGAMVRVELEDAEARAVHVETTRERYETLDARPGERFYVTPRRVRIFLDELTARTEQAL